jgi:hypothetical protein
MPPDFSLSKKALNVLVNFILDVLVSYNWLYFYMPYRGLG